MCVCLSVCVQLTVCLSVYLSVYLLMTLTLKHVDVNCVRCPRVFCAAAHVRASVVDWDVVLLQLSPASTTADVCRHHKPVCTRRVNRIIFLSAVSGTIEHSSVPLQVVGVIKFTDKIQCTTRVDVHRLHLGMCYFNPAYTQTHTHRHNALPSTAMCLALCQLVNSLSMMHCCTWSQWRWSRSHVLMMTRAAQFSTRCNLYVSHVLHSRPVAKGGLEWSNDAPPGAKSHFSANCSNANILNIVHL